MRIAWLEFKGDQMRDSIKWGLVGSGLLIVLGLGCYWQNPSEVDDWARSLGGKPLADNEIIVKQRMSALLPGLDGVVKIHVGDIERGKTANVDIVGPDSVALASRKRARIGDRIAFTLDCKKYEVEVLRYVDEIGPGDSARFRVIPSAMNTVP
jgi:hypothetical protein